MRKGTGTKAGVAIVVLVLAATTATPGAAADGEQVIFREGEVGGVCEVVRDVMRTGAAPVVPQVGRSTDNPFLFTVQAYNPMDGNSLSFRVGVECPRPVHEILACVVENIFAIDDMILCLNH